MSVCYKDSLSGFREWGQREHAKDWVLQPDNMGERLSVDESSCPKDEYTLQNIVINGGESFLISDIYIRDKDASQIAGNEELRIIDVLYRSDE